MERQRSRSTSHKGSPRVEEDQDRLAGVELRDGQRGLDPLAFNACHSACAPSSQLDDAVTRLSRNNRSLFRQTATGLALLLLLFLLPPCAAKHMPDWSKVQALSPGVITRVQLDKNEAPSGGRKIKGFFSSATDTSITLLFADGRTRTIEKRVVRTVRVRRPFKKRYTGFVIGAAVAVVTGLLYGLPGGDISPLFKFLIPLFYTVPATVAGFFMMPTKLVYRAQQTP